MPGEDLASPASALVASDMAQVILTGLAAVGTILLSDRPNAAQPVKTAGNRRMWFSNLFLDLLDTSFHHGDLLNASRTWANGAGSSRWSPKNAGHMDPIISPRNAGISGSTGQQLPLLQPLLYRLHVINKHVRTQEVEKKPFRQ